MAAVTTSTATATVATDRPSADASRTHSSISKFVAKLKLRAKRSERKRDGLRQVDTRPPLNTSPLPLVLPQHQATLPQLGWTTITFPQTHQQSHTSNPPPRSHLDAEATSAPGAHPLQDASQALFAAAQAFFAQPTSEKQQWKHRLASEEGWSHIPGEKEFITLRTLAYTPDVLKKPAKRYWDLMGSHLRSTLCRLSTSVDLSNDADFGFAKFVGPCATMGAQEEDKTATMLRIFRYEGGEAKVVAEPHADLGLLSCVVGDVAGLEVWDGVRFFDVERHYEAPCATMLAGRQLERFSNGRFPAGGHRVVSYGKAGSPARSTLRRTPNPKKTVSEEASTEQPQYRHSIVFVLRAHEPIPVHSAMLETEITGKWAEPVDGVTAGELYERIRRAHFNINIDKEEREKQRKKVLEGKGKNGAREGSG